MARFSQEYGDFFFRLLNASGADWTNLHATGVNNQGVIVGDGLFQGKERAFIATPIAADQR